MSSRSQEADSSVAPTDKRCTTRRLYGIIEFKSPLFCRAEVLGRVFPVRVGQTVGSLELPSSPIDSGRPPDPLSEPLIPPTDAKTWKHGDTQILWGRRFANQYPDGHPEVRRALLQFDVLPDQLVEVSDNVYQNFEKWKTRFFEGLDLFSTRWLPNEARVSGSRPSDLDLFVWNERGKQDHPYTELPISICLPIGRDLDAAISQIHVCDACKFASSNSDLPVPYQFQLAAYRAIMEEDFRKAIIETAVSAEITLTQSLEERLTGDGISYAKQILDKYRTLGGRVELAKAMGLAVPADIQAALVNPRNAVAHQGHLPTIKEALRAVNATKSVLQDHLPPIT